MPAPLTPQSPPTTGSCTPQTGANGIVDAFRIGSNGALVQIGAVTVPDAVGGQGIVAG